MRKQVWELGNNNIIGLKNVQNIFESKVREPNYLTFEILEDGVVTFTSEKNVLQWSFDNGNTWIEGNEIEVKKGDNVRCKGKCVVSSDMTGNSLGIGQFSTTCYYNLSGNVASLLQQCIELTEEQIIDNIYAVICGLYILKGTSGETLMETNYPNLSKKDRIINSISDNENRATMNWDEIVHQMYPFTISTQKYLLERAYDFIIKSELENINQMLPNYAELTPKEFFTTFAKMNTPDATDLDGIGFGMVMYMKQDWRGSYKSLFRDNIKLLNASELVVYAFIQEECTSMFYNCSSLITAPKLPTTILDIDCYNSMFSNCTSLAKAPELPATQLIGDCYHSMFENCTNLNYVKMLAIDAHDKYLYNWLKGVSPTGTFVKNSAATWDESKVIPDGWTVETVDV